MDPALFWRQGHVRGSLGFVDGKRCLRIGMPLAMYNSNFQTTLLSDNCFLHGFAACAPEAPALARTETKHLQDRSSHRQSLFGHTRSARMRNLNLGTCGGEQCHGTWIMSAVPPSLVIVLMVVKGSANLCK